jgi:hypothetical protein
MAIQVIWTASSPADAALQACSKSAARWGNAQAVTFYRPISKSRSGEMRWKRKVRVGGDSGGTEEKGPGGAAIGRGGMRGSLRRREAATEGQAVWRGTDALWVCDDAAVYRCGGEGSSGMARDRGEAVCNAVCRWARRRRRAKRRDERPEGAGRSETEEPVE